MEPPFDSVAAEGMNGWLIEVSDLGVMLFCPDCNTPLYFDTRVMLDDLTATADAHRCIVEVAHA